MSVCPDPRITLLAQITVAKGVGIVKIPWRGFDNHLSMEIDLEIELES